VSAPSACVLVLNYNGVAHLDACLSSLAIAAARAGSPCRVVLVDNRSTDDSVAFTRQRFPSVEVVVAPRNDFLFSLNEVVRARTEEIAIVVNNDMRFDRDFVAPLLPHFADPVVFAVGAAILNWTGDMHTVGPRCARLERGWFHKWWSAACEQPALTLEASGGAAAYRREMFVALGGFDPLFRPGYYEDLDLSYRGWSHGWRVVYEPRSRAFHKESVSMVARLGDAGKARLLYRNHLLFTVKNVGDASFLTRFLVRLPYRIFEPLLHGYSVPLRGCLAALPLLPAAFKRRFGAGRRPLDVNRFNAVVPLDTFQRA
jgi:N-acetylglucosaminyl-diphospho-decaprenol L-rhamnosyltransferase